MTEEEILAQIRTMLDAGVPREQIDEFVREAKSKMATPQSSKFQYSTEPTQKSVQAPVVKEKEPKFSFDFMEKDTGSGVELDENFFNLQDGKAVEKLRASIYGNSYNFEELVYDKEIGFSGVKISTKDGRHSEIIEFNIDGRHQPSSYMVDTALAKQKNNPNSLNNVDKRVLRQVEENKKAYQTAYGNLTKFIKTHATEDILKSISKEQDEIKEATIDFNKSIAQDISAIERRFSIPNPDFNPNQEESNSNPSFIPNMGIFNHEKEVTYTPTGKFGTNVYKEVVTKKPYEKELLQAQKELGIEPKDVDANSDAIMRRAWDIVTENERLKLKERKIVNFAEELEDGEILPASLIRYKDDTKKLKEVLTTGTKMFQKEYAAKVELFEQEKNNLETDKSIKNFTNLSKKINDPSYEFNIIPGEPVVTLEDGRVVPQAIMNQYESERIRLKPKFSKFFELQNDLIDNRYNIQDASLQLDLLRRDYNDGERFINVMGTHFAELALNIGGAVEDPAKHKAWQDAKNRLQAKRDEYAKPVPFDEAFDSWSNFGKFATNEVATQIPIFTALAIPKVGWGVLLASSYGEQYGEMTAEEIASKGTDKEVDYSMWEKVATSAGYAAPELIFEMATTLPLLRGAGNALKGMYGSSVRDLTFQGVKDFSKEALPKFVTGSLAESASEGLTSVTQNIVTGKPWHENVNHAMFSGLMFGTTLAGTPVVAGAITNTLSDYNSSSEFRNNIGVSNALVQANKNLSNKIISLKGQKEKILKEGGDVSDIDNQIDVARIDKANNTDKIQELANKNETILKDQKESILGRWLGVGQDNRNGMSENAFKDYLEATTQQEQLRIQAEKIINSNAYSRQEKQKKLQQLKTQGTTLADGTKVYGFDELQSFRDGIKAEKNNDFNAWKSLRKNKAKLDEYLKTAKNAIEGVGDAKTIQLVKTLKDKSENNIARILYNIDTINNNLVKPVVGRKTNLEKDLIVYQTIEDAVNGLTKLEVDQDAIKKIKEGSHGFDSKKLGKSVVVVENMAKDDRLQTKTHELSHRLLRNAISEDPKAFQEIANTIMEWAGKNDKGLFSKLNRLVARDPNTKQMVADEVVAVFLEEVASNNIELKSENRGIGGVFGFMTSKVMKDKHGVDMNLAGESDAIQLMIGLGKKIAAGKMTLKDVAALKKSRVAQRAKFVGDLIDKLKPTGDTKFSEPSSFQPTVQNDLFKSTNTALVESLEMYGLKDAEKLLSEDVNVRKELAKEWEKLGDKKLWIGTVIGEHWKKFLETNYLSKRDKAANYQLYKDEIIDVAATGIAPGDNGIPFLVRSWKPDGGRSLTSHIFGEIETRLMKEGGIIDRKFPQFDKFISTIDMSRDDGGMDVAGDLDIEAVLKAEEIKETRRRDVEEDRYRKRIGIDDKFAEEIKNEIKEVLLQGDLGLISDFEWTQRFSKAAQKKLFKTIKNEMKDYEAFLKKTRKSFIKHAHTSDLVQMEKREAKKIFAELKAVNASPNKIKLALLEGLIQPFEVKSMTQGPNIYSKKDTQEQEFIDFMKVRGRKDAYVKSNINIISMDAVFDVLLNQTVEVDGKQVRVLDEFVRKQKQKGLPHASNVLSIVKERINRDQDAKFSSTVRNFNDLDLRIFYGNLDKLGSKIDLINLSDEKEIRKIVEETYGKFYNKTTMDNLSKDLFKLVKRYATIDQNHTNLKTKPEKTLEEYLYDNVKAAELEMNLAEFLDLKNIDGKFIKLSNAFDDIDRINNQRAEILTVGKKLVEKYGEQKALMMLIHASGMYATSTKIGRGKFKVNDKGLVYEVTPEQINKKKFGSQRYQVFDGKKDFNKNVLKKIFPNISLTDADNLTKIQEVTVDGKKTKIDISLLAESSEKGMQDKDFVSREAQAKLSEEFVKDMAQHYKDQIEAKVLDKTDFGMLMMSMASNMQSPLKRAANLKYIYKDKKGKKYKGKLRYEHMIPTNFMVLKITDAYMSDKSNVDLDNLFKEYTVAIIPETMDTNVLEAMGLQYKMPIGFDAGQSSRVRYYNMSTYGHPDLYAIQSIDPKDKGKVYGEATANIKMSESLAGHIKLNNAKFKARTNKYSKKPKGITVLDFDDTLATTESLVKFTRPDGTTGTLNAEQYASTYEDLLDQGFTFDFSDFNKVVKGKLAPLFQKALKLQGKFGPENMFVLTARPPAAAKPIFDFLKANGLNIPLKNITGLANSTSEAKALWIADKVGEGYNDFYFADDALQNVQAVDNMLEQFDVKRKVQQAKIKFSENMNGRFNDILEAVTGIDSKKRFSDIKARKRGASKGKFRFFIPPSHEDFVGLLYNFMGKGREGDKHRDFFEQALVRPLNKAYREIDTAKQAIANDYKELNKQFKDIKKKLTKKTPDGDFTFEDAIRIYLWNKHGYDIPGLSPTDRNNLSEIVMKDADLRAYAETLNVISKQDTYVDPGQGWEGGNIKTDLIDATGRVGRAQYFAEFNENADILFSPENLNKIEAAYGKDFRSALEDMLHRISTGINRPKGQSGTVNKFMNYLNGSVGTVMFFNVRSAILQQMSIVNYINFADNNIFAAAKAFANQKQYWQDFAFIFNSDMLKQRRGGIGTDINGADLAQAVAGSKNPSKVVISRLLQLGFLPTQIGDNIAIATGGATFYRNRINKYIKDGLSKKEAETKAFTDFQDLTQSTQQSSRPDMTSQQQSSWIGKLVLNFQNITSQYNRIIKKAALDIAKGRISPPYTTRTQSNLGNLSKILYYGGIQNVIFYSLQTALFAIMFDDDEDEDQILKKRERVIQGSIDSILRGAGIYGAVASTLKNTLIKFKEQREKGYNKDESAVPLELLNFSPVVGIKIRQIVNAEKTLNYNENIISEMETFDADNPQWSAVTNYTQALTNFPANRLYQKSINMRNALDKDYTNFQRVMFFSGYTTWSLGLGDNEAIIEAKEKIKINKANAIKEKRVQKQIEKIKKMTPKEKLFDLTKKQQVDSLTNLGLTKSEIRKLQYEKDRVNKIIQMGGKPIKRKKEAVDFFGNPIVKN